jgi:hypothetical protein
MKPGKELHGEDQIGISRLGTRSDKHCTVAFDDICIAIRSSLQHTTTAMPNLFIALYKIHTAVCLFHGSVGTLMTVQRSYIVLY